MTNRIVQLTDQEDNNIFPISIIPDSVARITMTDTDPGEGEPLAANNFIGVYGGTGYVDTDDIANGAVTTAKIGNAAVTSSKIDFATLGENYSLDEQDTGFTWLNGETIYKKTVSIGALPDSNTKIVAHDISNLAGVIKIEGIVFDPRTSIWLPLPLVYEGDSSGYNVSVYVSTTLVAVKSTSDRSMLTPAYVTLYYTKAN